MRLLVPFRLTPRWPSESVRRPNARGCKLPGTIRLDAIIDEVDARLHAMEGQFWELDQDESMVVD